MLNSLKISIGVFLFFFSFNSFTEESSIKEVWDPRDPKKGFIEEDSEGNFLYDESNLDEAKYYDEDDNRSLNQKILEQKKSQQLLKIQNDGSYLYEPIPSEQSEGFSIRFGQMGPPQITNQFDMTFEDFYGTEELPIFLYDFEKQNIFNIRNLSLLIGTEGFGRFASDISLAAKEKYNFYIFPNHIGLNYRFQYSNRQWIAPYIYAGILPVVLIEHRNDEKDTDIVTTLGFQAGAGLKFNLHAFDPYSAGLIDSEYGINNVWLDIDFRAINGTDEKINISSSIINLGFAFDY